ncbi:MAG: DUF177 domain-containing protein [Bacteroidales bacterium]|nr:DUF177 domain-containing protein [Bacteroidales bacterium]
MFDIKEYIIEVSKLRKGDNTFEFNADKQLFEFFECNDADDVKAIVKVNALKHERFIEFSFHFEGTIIVECSRCLAPVTLRINKNTRLYVKIGHSDDKHGIEEVDINEWLIDENENEIDLSRYVYEELRVEIPIAPVHKKKSDCDAEMLNKLSQINEESSINKEEIDPRWEKLKSLIKE